MKYLILSIIVLSLACSKKDQVKGVQSAIYVVNASPNSGKLQVLQNLKAIGSAEYAYVTGINSNISSYQLIDSGFNHYKIKKGTTEFANTLFSNQSAKLSFWIYDSISATKIKYLFLKDQLDTPGRAKAKVRYLFLSPDMDTVNVTGNNATTNLYNNASYFLSQQLIDGGNLASFVTIDTGFVLLKLVKKNTSVIIKSYQLRFESNQVYTVLFKGYQKRTGADSLSLSVIKHN
jgi:hypothetical protein